MCRMVSFLQNGIIHFEIIHPVLEIDNSFEEFLVHPVLPLHQGADKIAKCCLGLHVRDLGIAFVQIILGQFTDPPDRHTGGIKGKAAEPGPALHESWAGLLCRILFLV